MPKPTTRELASKVPAVTLGFWLIKILATTLGETSGDTVSERIDRFRLAMITIGTNDASAWQCERCCPFWPVFCWS